MIRPARIEATQEILALIHELAVYEKAPDQAKATAASQKRTPMIGSTISIDASRLSRFFASCVAPRMLASVEQ